FICDYFVFRSDCICGEYILYKHSLSKEQVVDNLKPGVKLVVKEFSISGAAAFAFRVTFGEAKIIVNHVRLAYRKSMACSSQSSLSTILMTRPPKRRKILFYDEVDNDHASSIIDNSLFIFSQLNHNDVSRQLY
ncbi:hypothetical protein EWB00_005113, partial [Schistosoma japonicum]